MRKQLLSVLLPVYNGQKSISHAIHSCLDQSFKDFELVIVDDGSTDKTREIVQAISDPRLRLLKAEHKGIASALNRGLGLIKTDYIARMDADDICHRDRFKKQIEFLEINPKVGAVSCLVKHGGSPDTQKRVTELTLIGSIINGLRRNSKKRFW